MEVKIKKLRLDAELPSYATEYSAGMDIKACMDEPIVLSPMERTLIPTGLAMELPIGYEAQIRPRSGMSIKFGLTLINCIGTIDCDYRGELKVPIVNLSQEAQTIQSGDRIAQMIVQHLGKITIKESDELSDTQRGEGGFGSSGVQENNYTKT